MKKAFMLTVLCLVVLLLVSSSEGRNRVYMNYGNRLLEEKRGRGKKGNVRIMIKNRSIAKDGGDSPMKRSMGGGTEKTFWQDIEDLAAKNVGRR